MSNPEHKVAVYAGYWEPLAHFRRGGAWFADDERAHGEFHSQEMVDKLKALGVTTAVWPGYKGLGMQFERAEWEHLKPMRKMFEKAGIELGTYLQCGSFWAETFYAENPQAREWTALDYWGKPHAYSEYYRCYWRHRPCLTHRAFSEYVGRVASVLVKDYGVTYFYADNNAQMPCYTPHFAKGFHEFLKEKYATNTADGLARFVRRYGHPNVDHVELPAGSPRRPIDALPGLVDPCIQDWVEFRCRLVARNAQIISAAAKAANPAARLCFNFSYDYGEFNQLIWGTEPEFLAEIADHVMSEDGNAPRVEPDGRLVSHVHTCKHLRALNRRGHFHPPYGDRTQPGRNLEVLSLMELAIQNQGSLGPVFEFGNIDTWDGDERPSTVRFIRQHEDVFTNNECVSEIGVLRSRHSHAINWVEATEGRLCAQSALFQAGFQWDNVIEATPQKDLEKYRLLVLPDSISVPDAFVKQIAQYVRDGGRVLAVGEALARNDWGRRRSPARIDPLQGERDTNYGTTQGDGYAVAILSAWLGLEDKYAERLFAFPRLRHPKPYIWQVDEAAVPVLGADHHALPLNYAEFIACVHEALGAPPMIEVISGRRGPYVIPTLLRSRAAGDLSLHLLNYKPSEEVDGMAVRLRLPESSTPRGGKLIRLESNTSESIPVTRGEQGVTLQLPSFRRYAGVLFE